MEAWAKNDHLGFEISNVFQGVVQKHPPDFIIPVTDGTHLILENKGQETPKDRTKWEYLAVNEHGGFGKWGWPVSKNPADLVGILAGN